MAVRMDWMRLDESEQVCIERPFNAGTISCSQTSEGRRLTYEGCCHGCCSIE